MTELANKIKKLYSEGKSKKEISNILNCNIATVYYNTDPNYKIREKFRYHANPIYQKIKQFFNDKDFAKQKKESTKNIKSLLLWKIINFHTSKRGEKPMKPTFSVEDIINKFGENPKCYLTGQDIDLSKPRTYEFDHIIPKSRGGQNTLDNLGICTKEANRAKQTMTPDEFTNLCKIILENHGYLISKQSVKESNSD